MSWLLCHWVDSMSWLLSHWVDSMSGLLCFCIDSIIFNGIFISFHKFSLLYFVNMVKSPQELYFLGLLYDGIKGNKTFLVSSHQSIDPTIVAPSLCPPISWRIKASRSKFAEGRNSNIYFSFSQTTWNRIVWSGRMEVSEWWGGGK